MATQIHAWTHETFEDSPIARAESFLLLMGIVCSEEVGLLDEHGPLDPSPYGFSGPTLETILGHTFGAPITPEQAQGLCAQLDVEAAPALEVEPIYSAIPTLVLSGGMDMDTSFVWGALAASRLEHAQHSGHVTALSDLCPRSVAAQFIRDPGAELDTSCHAEEMALSEDLVLTTADILAEIKQHVPDTLSTK